MVRTKVFVGNLSFQTQEAELAAEFGTAGKVISANIITRGPRSLGYGFVEMDSEEDAHNAVKLMSKKEINGREINVEIAKPQDESKVRQPRPPKEEEGEDARRRRPRRRPKKETEEGGAQPSQGQKKESREGEEGSDEARKPRNRKRKPAPAPGQKKVESEENREESKTTLFVANLPFSLDDDGFAKVVSDLGLKLKVAHVVKKRNGRSKGYGFVEFENQEDQKKALDALNKKVIEERELSVKIALTEIRRDEQQEEKKEASKPAEKKAAPAEKKAAPAEKKAAPAEKKAAPAEKKSSPAPTEKKSAPAEKKSSPAPAEKKASAPAQTGAPAEKKAAAPAEKKSAPAEKKTATPEKKDEKK
jgi:RNA recognition motif-containing protein